MLPKEAQEHPRAVPTNRRLVSRAEETRKHILDESTYPKPSSTIIFYTDNVGTMARIFTGSLSRHRNTRHSISRAEETRKDILDESTHLKPLSNIIFRADNAGTLARIFTGSLSRRKNTRRLVITTFEIWGRGN